MWLLREDIAQKLASAHKAGLTPSAEQRTQFEARATAARDKGQPYSLSVAGDVAEIRIEGVLTKDWDLFAMWFGGGNTAYNDIIGALAVADADPNVKRAILNVDSPGGTVEGLFETIAAMQSFTKPITLARCVEACSAAFGLACMAKKVEAVNAAASFGSVGVAIDFMIANDITRISITSTEAPDKRPDPLTPEGQAVYRAHLDAVHELFADAIAGGRGTTADKVNKDFGRGAVLLAGEAKRRGMIDSIAQPVLRDVNGQKGRASAPSGGEQATRTKKMEEKELRAQHPDLYEAVLNKGVAQGQATERDRCTAHLTMGEKSGDMKTAIGAVKSGEGMTLTLQAEYMTAAMNRSDRRTRQEESDEVGAAADGAAAPAAASEDIGDQVAAIVDQRKGKVKHG
jgi:ClpP class serine protease